MAPVIRIRSRLSCVAILRCALGLVEPSLGGRLGQCHQEAQPSPRGASYYDQGEHIDNRGHVHHLPESVLLDRSTAL